MTHDTNHRELMLFGDATLHNGREAMYENTRNGKVAGWTSDDFHYAMNVHVRAFGPTRTAKVLGRMFGTTDPTQVPAYARGVIIGALAAEMACGAEHKIPRSPLYAGKSK